MIYDKRNATVSPAEFDELMVFVRAPPEEPRPLTDGDHWRREYQAEQQCRRVIGYQPDLFTANLSARRASDGEAFRHRRQLWPPA